MCEISNLIDGESLIDVLNYCILFIGQQPFPWGGPPPVPINGVPGVGRAPPPPPPRGPTPLLAAPPPPPPDQHVRYRHLLSNLSIVALATVRWGSL